MSGGGGRYWYSMMGAGSVLNSDYGKIAADSIAKEIEERNLVASTTAAQAVASSADPISPATGTDKIAPGEDQTSGGRA
jgi:hypothetical protein